MSTPDYYRSMAAQFREFATRSRDPQAERRWLEMALDFDRLARMHERHAPAAESQVERRPIQQQQARSEPGGEG